MSLGSFCQLVLRIMPKVENYVLLGGHSEDFKPGDSISDNAEKLFQRGKWRARMYESFCNKRSGNHNIKRLLWIKENQRSQVKKFSTFPCIRRWKSLGSLTFPLICTSLSGASILCFLILSLLGCLGRGCGRSRLLDGGQILPPAWVPSGLTVRMAVMWWLNRCNILCLCNIVVHDLMGGSKQ